MRTLYLIFSHDNLEQLQRLVHTLRSLSPDSAIAIHHDPARFKVQAGDFPGVSDIFIIPDPVRGEWGDYSQVEQYLHAINWCHTNLEYGWLITLSGLTYPTKNLQAFERGLQTSGYDAYVYHFGIYDPEHWPAGTGVTRLHFTYFRLPRFPYYYRFPRFLKDGLAALRLWLNGHQPFIRILPMPRGANTRFGIRRLILRPTSTPGFVLMGGRNILNLSSKAVEHIFAFDRKHPEFKRFLRRTICPDETFFTSIIANDPDLNVCNNVLRFIKWPRQHAASGALISCDDVPEILASLEPFSLKLDCNFDPEAQAMIDAALGLGGGAHGN